MSKTAEDNSYAGIANGTPERVIADITGVQGLAGPHTPMDYAECLKCMREFAAQEVEAYKYALKAELQSRVNGTRGLEHLSFEDISEIIDTVK